jgi:hypothetical protein
LVKAAAAAAAATTTTTTTLRRTTTTHNPHLQQRLGPALVGVVDPVRFPDVFDAHERHHVLLVPVGNSHGQDGRLETPRQGRSNDELRHFAPLRRSLPPHPQRVAGLQRPHLSPRREGRVEEVRVLQVGALPGPVVEDVVLRDAVPVCVRPNPNNNNNNNK